MLLTFLLAVFAQPTTAPVPPRPAIALSVHLDEVGKLSAKIRKQGDKVDRRLFRRLAAIGSDKAFHALKKAIKGQDKLHNLRAAYEAFDEFKAEPLATEALDFLTKAATKHREDEHRIAAVQGLIRLGDLAHPALEKVVRGKAPDAVKRNATRPIVERLGKAGDAQAIGVLVDFGPVDRGMGPKLVKALGDALTQKTVNLVSKAIKAEGRDARKPFLLDALAAGDEPWREAGLIGALASESDAVLVHAIGLVGDKRYPAAERPLRNHLRGSNGSVVRAAMAALTKLKGDDEEWIAELLKHSQSNDSGRRRASVGGLELSKRSDTLDRLHELLGDEDWKVRATTVRALRILRNKSSIPELIQQLDRERGRMLLDVANALRALTGLDHGQRSTRWERWWQAEGSGFVVPSMSAAEKASLARAERRAANESQATFYGLQVVSERVAFVIDRSGSMTAPAGGSTRMQVAKEQVAEVAKRLPDGTLLQIVFFSSDVDTWLDDLEPLDDELKEDLLDYVDRMGPGGNTNVFDGLMRALDESEIDTIYLLTDGQPTAGEVTDPAMIRARVAAKNEGGLVTIHTISIGQKSPFLQALAKENGGTYVERL